MTKCNSTLCGCIPTDKDLENEPIIHCPKCNVEMVKLTNGKYIIDLCKICGGIFLDKNEIDTAHKIGFIPYIMDYFRKDKKVKK